MNSSIRWVIGIVIAIAVLNSCSKEFGNLGTAFNTYITYFQQETSPTTQSLDKTITIRFRLFGSEYEKQKAWEREHPDTTGPVQWAGISSQPYEIWGVLRERNGVPVVDPLLLGHEVVHPLIGLVVDEMAYWK